MRYVEKGIETKKRMKQRQDSVRDGQWTLPRNVAKRNLYNCASKKASILTVVYFTTLEQHVLFVCRNCHKKWPALTVCKVEYIALSTTFYLKTSFYIKMLSITLQLSLKSANLFKSTCLLDTYIEWIPYSINMTSLNL